MNVKAIHCNIIQTKIKTGSNLKVQAKHDGSTVNPWYETEQCREMLFYESGIAHLAILRTKMFSNHPKIPLLSELIGMCTSLIPSLRQAGLKDNLVHVETQSFRSTTK